MVEMQVNTAALAAVAGQGAGTAGATPNSAGFFAQALAAASGAATGKQPGAAALAGQSLLLTLPPGFLASQLSGAQLSAAAAAQAAQGNPLPTGQAGNGRAAQGNPLLAGQAGNGQAAAVLFDKLATQLAALGVGNGDPKQVVAQLTALGLSRGDFKQLAAKLAQSNGANTDAKSLELALQQVAQDLVSGQVPDPALLGALAAQLTALQGGGVAPGSAERVADVAVDRKDLPLANGKSAVGATAGAAAGAAAGSVAAAKAEILADGGSKASFAEHLAAKTEDEDGSAPALMQKLLDAGGALAKVVTDAAVPPVAVTSNPTDASAVRVDGLGMVAAPKAAQVVAASEALMVRTPVRAPGWEADFAQKVVWMAGRDSQSAQLTLNPPQLGTVEVRLTLSGGEAGAQFFSPHHNVREAIETAMPRLRDMMAEAGLSLGQASVSSESFRDQRANTGGSGQFASAEAGGEAQEAQNTLSVGQSRNATQGRGLVDLYA